MTWEKKVQSESVGHRFIRPGGILPDSTSVPALDKYSVLHKDALSDLPTALPYRSNGAGKVVLPN